jgi:cytidine deaminase
MTPLTDRDREVLAQAVAAADRLYVAGVQEVGAAVGTAGGPVFAGIHFESAAGFATVCGEVAALSCMVAAGHRDLDVVAAVWRDPEGRHVLLPPCGRCRELVSDFNPEAWVIVTESPDHWDRAAIDRPVKVRIGDLLPRKSHRLPTP